MINITSYSKEFNWIGFKPTLRTKLMINKVS